jgi:conjugative transposon TraJ protein
MANYISAAKYAALGLLLPLPMQAQSFADEMAGMHSILEQLYEEMMPLCSSLLGVSQGIAGFAALWYIASRVWRHLANAEPIDLYPLLRPFAIGFCIMIFPSVLGLINGVMKPTVTATGNMVEGSNRAIEVLLERKEQAIQHTDAWQMYVGQDGSGDQDRWYKYTHDDEDPDSEGVLAGIGNDIRFAMEKYSYSFRNSVKEWMSEILRVLFEAAALCIDTLRTFQMVVLSILGPLVFALSVFDGFQHTLTVWLARYINIFLWLPVANIFGSIIGKIQEKMLELDIAQVGEYGDTFFSRTDVAYLVFMIIGIVGYFTVPSVANYIVHAGGSALNQKVNSVFSSGATTAVQSTSAAAGMAADGLGNMASKIYRSMAGHGSTSPYFDDKDTHQGDKIKGNS